MKSHGMTSNPKKHLSNMLDFERPPRFVQESPLPPFPQIIRKAKKRAAVW